MDCLCLQAHSPNVSIMQPKWYLATLRIGSIIKCAELTYRDMWMDACILVYIHVRSIIGILQSRETMVTCSESRSVLSRAWSPGKIIWRIGCYPSSKSPLSTLLKWSNGKARGNTTGSSKVAGVGRMTRTAFRTPAPDFASRLTPEAFSMSGYSHMYPNRHLPDLNQRALLPSYISECF